LKTDDGEIKQVAHSKRARGAESLAVSGFGKWTPEGMVKRAFIKRLLSI
jgi:hypothetical protein